MTGGPSFQAFLQQQAARLGGHLGGLLGHQAQKKTPKTETKAPPARARNDYSLDGQRGLFYLGHVDVPMVIEKLNLVQTPALPSYMYNILKRWEKLPSVDTQFTSAAEINAYLGRKDECNLHALLGSIRSLGGRILATDPDLVEDKKKKKKKPGEAEEADESLTNFAFRTMSALAAATTMPELFFAVSESGDPHAHTGGPLYVHAELVDRPGYSKKKKLKRVTVVLKAYLRTSSVAHGPLEDAVATNAAVLGIGQHFSPTTGTWVNSFLCLSDHGRYPTAGAEYLASLKASGISLDHGQLHKVNSIPGLLKV